MHYLLPLLLAIASLSCDHPSVSFSLSIHTIISYANVSRPDWKTEKLKALGYQWHDIYGLSTDQVCDKIRQDGVDILVELAGHTGNNRLDVMARKPAPVQVTWIGYPNTTGLASIDYRITDAVVGCMCSCFHSISIAHTPPMQILLIQPSNSLRLCGDFHTASCVTHPFRPRHLLPPLLPSATDSSHLEPLTMWPRSIITCSVYGLEL